MNKKLKSQNITVPNILTLIRILIIPFFVDSFLKDNLLGAICVLLVSGISDILDGFIARKFNQITEFGKILDPFADKLTGVSIAVTLAVKFPSLCPFLVFLAVKDIAMVVCGLVLLKRNLKPSSAKWYGKVSTAFFYVSVTIIVLMSINQVEVFNLVSTSLLTLTTLMMFYSGIRYLELFKETMKSENFQDKFNSKDEIWEKI